MTKQTNRLRTKTKEVRAINLSFGLLSARCTSDKCQNFAVLLGWGAMAWMPTPLSAGTKRTGVFGLWNHEMRGCGRGDDQWSGTLFSIPKWSVQNRAFKTVFLELSRVDGSWNWRFQVENLPTKPEKTVINCTPSLKLFSWEILESKWI